MLLDESVLPYRIAKTFEAKIPRDRDGLMDAQSDRLDSYEGLASWWRKAEEVWEKHRSSDRLSLIDQLDYQNKFRQQFPLQAERIVYNKSGMHLAAARVTDKRAVIDHRLY